MSANNEGDFKKGRFKPGYILLGVGILGLAGGTYYLAKKTSDSRMSATDLPAEVRKVLVKPVNEQLAAWRKVIEDPKADERFRQEAIFQLARLRDRESAPKLLKILEDSTDHATIRVIAMALIEFPREDLKSAGAILRKKLDASDTSDKPQIAAALVHIRDPEAFDKILPLYRDGKLNSAKGVDGSSSFDPTDLALMCDRAKFRSLEKDSSEAVRQLVAQVLSLQPTKEDLAALTALLDDKSIDVSSSASVGIAKLNDPAASKILVDKLAAVEKTDNETARKRYIEALKNGIGGTGLVWALRVTDAELEHRGRFILEEMRDLADPDAAAAYKEYLKDEKQPAHYRAQVALALGDIGDPDAVAYLAQRMDAQGIGFNCGTEKSKKCLSNNLGWTKQPPVDADPVTFREQQFSATYIADLAILYPDKKKDFLAAAGPHLKAFNAWFPAPWLNVSRALAYLDDPESAAWCKKIVKDYKLPPDDLVDLGKDPNCPKDRPMGCQVFALNEFATAARYVGRAGDLTFLDNLAGYLGHAKDKKGNEFKYAQSDMELAQNPGFREAAMSVAQGSVDGLAEWGPPAAKVADKVLKLVEDRDHGIFARYSAGRAFGMIASEKDIAAALVKIKASTDVDAKVALLMAAQIRPSPEAVVAATDMFVTAGDMTVNQWAARVVGWGGAKAVGDRLLKMLEDKDLRPYAALAIALGGDDDLVRRGMVLFEQKSRESNRWADELNAVRTMYLNSFDSRGLTIADIDTGRLQRFVHNALLMKRSGASLDKSEADGSSHEWASAYLIEGFKRLDMNATIPGGMDRVIMRTKLIRLAKTGDDAQKQAALDTLQLLREQGVIMSLRAEAGATGELARKAFFTMRNPSAGGPASKDKEKSKGPEYMSAPKK